MTNEEEMHSKDGGTDFAVGFMLGAVVGLAIGFLYAPRPVEETRRILEEKAEEVANPIKKILFRLRWLTMSAGARYAYLWATQRSRREPRGR